MFGKTNIKIPVYMINGFLESGKTDFISFTISQDYFRTGERTLLVLCEEGEQEYDPKTLKRTNTILEVIEDEEDFTVDALNYLVNKDKVSRVIMVSDGKISTEKIMKEEYRKNLDELTTDNLAEVESHEEYSIMDKAHRVQLSEDFLEMAGIDTNKVRVEVKDGKIIISK